MSERSECRRCHAPILWARTQKGKSIPLDAEPNMAGNVELVKDERFAGLVAVVRGKNTPPTPGRTLYMPHHATCPNAAEFRKRA